MSKGEEFLKGQNRMCASCGAGPMSPVENRTRTTVRTAPLKEGGKRKNQYKYGPVTSVSWFCPEDFGHTVTEEK
jgi:hypothetical protein